MHTACQETQLWLIRFTISELLIVNPSSCSLRISGSAQTPAFLKILIWLRFLFHKDYNWILIFISTTSLVQLRKVQKETVFLYFVELCLPNTFMAPTVPPPYYWVFNSVLSFDTKFPYFELFSSTLVIGCLETCPKNTRLRQETGLTTSHIWSVIFCHIWNPKLFFVWHLTPTFLELKVAICKHFKN